MNLVPRNSCPMDCTYFDSEESGDNFYQWCHHPSAEEERVGTEECVVTCPMTGRSIEYD